MQEASAQSAPYPMDEQTRSADSIMSKVIFFAPLYERIVESYRADLYIKGWVNICKKNHFLRYIPSMFRPKRGVREYMMETYNDLHFTAPNIYDQKVKSAMGTASDFWELDGRLPEYFHINVYASTLLHDKLLSPLASNAKKYYTYRLDTVMGEKHDLQYKIRFMPKYKSFQLVGGYLVVSDNVWSVREMRFSGRNEMVRFNNLVKMGDVGASDEFLPLQYAIDASFHLLGNVIEGKYEAVLNYRDIIQKAVGDARRTSSKSRYDLSDCYTLSTDTNAYQRDTTYFNALRPIPLTPREKTLYDDFFLHRDTLARKKRPKNKNVVLWGQIGDALISRYTVKLDKLGSIRCSPLINPLLMSYSRKQGLSYRQEFKYNCLFKGERLLRIVPRIGYSFKEKIFYWSISSDFDYCPRKKAAFHLEAGNGNRIYSSGVLDELKSIPDSIFDFKQIHLDYFNDLYLNLRHSWEIVNGLSLEMGVSVHRRTEVNRSKFMINLEKISPRTSTTHTGQTDVVGLAPLPSINRDVLTKFRHTYNSFAPRIRLSWTPGQYYYMDGRRKVNLHSKYPTLSVDWERGLKGLLSGSSSYERIEIDLQHQLSLGLMRSIYWRLGWGEFTNQEELFFVDFVNLRRSNLPMGWSDDIGGVFQLLDGRWYNSSRKYLRGHFVYEAPFLLLSHLKKYTQHVLNERLYLNSLVVPHLKPYMEAGYGIGTHIFDFGVFASFANWKYQEIGCKFTFELFNR
ncbi:hypothetical protein JN06_00729 [Bacteroides zoogleoformans]|uniref:Surface antigen-like protein n=1 Tax=Bacteroides zoogleoformans TaxID=28119 RepID=A0ABN5INP2_9BACE|nr:DUF5686 family protein [Bacteroides zoogleoformans]AVM54098.1 hypothetical protein C4H11_11755 [Bacteroides zoogleoformans]TWJ17416.1 hypothetical protein JN06_00729 [Bacteroides zoogleoformans]